jgi:hypothetical protein
MSATPDRIDWEVRYESELAAPMSTAREIRLTAYANCAG